MSIGSRLRVAVALFGFLLLVRFPTVAGMTAAVSTVESRTAEVDGLRIHYLTAGRGPAVILLHGYTQTSRMWRPIIPPSCAPIHGDRARSPWNRRVRYTR
jgi:hypothetical protein